MLEHPPLKCAMDSDQPILMDQSSGDQIIQEPDVEVVTSTTADHNTVILDNTLSMAGLPSADAISPQETIVNTSYAEIDDEWHMHMVANGNPDCNNLVTDITNVTVKTESADTIADGNYNEMDDEWQMQIQLISLVTDVTVKIENEEIVTESSNDSENVILTELAAEPEIPIEKQEFSEPSVVLIDEDTSSLIETNDMSAPIQVIAAEDLDNTYFDVGIQTIGEEYTVTDDISSSDDSDSDTASPVSKASDIRHLNSFNVCTVCNKEFSDRSACQRHMIAAHEEAKYQCTKCDKNFYRAYSLKIHIKKKHNGEGLYFCDKCNNCYSCKFYYDQHRKRNCTPVQCCDCGRGLANMLQLQIHRRRVHKK